MDSRGTLAGDQVVPAVESPYRGLISSLSLALGEGTGAGETISWDMMTSLPLTEVTAIHLHDGFRGENGPVVYTVPEQIFGVSDTVFVQASMDYDGSVPVAELIELVRAGGAYVDVHTIRYPAGELRAQLTTVRFDDRSGYYCS